VARRRVRNRAAPRASGASFRRRPGERPVKKLALIVCEGEKTEPNYFRALREHFHINTAAVRIPPNPRGSAPISVVDFAAKIYQEDGGYDRVYCVFDKDEHESYERAMQRVRGYALRKLDSIPMQAMTSVPCFEFWLLLHFTRTTRPMGRCDKVIAQLRRYLQAYVKGGGNIVDELLPHIDDAISNGRWVSAQQAAAGTDNPSTNVHELVEALKTMAIVETA